MKHGLLFLLYFVLYGADTFGVDLSLAPGLSVKNAVLYSVFGALVIESAVTRQRRIEAASVLAPFMLYVLYAIFMWVIALVVLDYPGYSLMSSFITLKGGPIDDLIVLLVFFYGVATAHHALWLLRGILWIVILGNMITVIEGMDILNLGLIGDKYQGRVVGPIGNANLFGYLLAFLLPIMVAQYWTATGITRVLAGFGALVSGLAFLMAVSRGAFVGLAVGGVLGLVLLRKIIPAAYAMRVTLVVGVSSIILLFIASMGGYLDLLTNRIEELGEGGYGASSGRTWIWTLLINRMLEDPITFLTGFGWHVYRTFQHQHVFQLSAHSTYLTILFNLGLIGLSLFLLTLANALGIARAGAEVADAQIRPFLVGFVLGLSGLMVALIFNDLYGAWLYIWPVIGVCLRLAVSELSVAESSQRERIAAIKFKRGADRLVEGTGSGGPGRRAVQ
jgi:hypothetical protein